MLCKNCNNSFEGSFCNSCGQKSDVQRVNFKYLVNEIPNSILKLNRGFLFTLKELLIRPGHSIREFLEGKRVNHYKPIAFLLITSTLYGLSAYLMDRYTFIEDWILGFKEGVIGNEEADFTVFNWITENQIYVLLIILPLFSLASYLSFFKSKYNYFEHLILNFYISGQQMLIYLVLGFIFFQDNLLLLIPLITGFCYNIWTYHQFFEQKRFWTKLGLIALSYLIFFTLLIVIFVAVGVLVRLFG